MYKFVSLAILTVLFPAWAAIASPFVIPEGMSEVDRVRFKRFGSFQIRGVCGDRDFERLATIGVNTVRGYTIESARAMRNKLDHAHSLGLMMIVSEWMPHHGENKGKDGTSWTFDYEVRGDDMVQAFVTKVDAIGDHPAILMWGLGNEIHLDAQYLRAVNRMSLAIHERFPHHITSLTMVNAKPEAIAAVKQSAPDIDVLGIQSYSPGAVKGAIKSTEEHWGKPFYMSEFNGKGPWNLGKTAWGVALDEPVNRKVHDVNECYNAIDSSPLCLGSTIFVWGHYSTLRPTYFSLLLDPDPNGPGRDGGFDNLLTTPQADVMIRRFTGQPPRGNQAPVLSRLEFAEGGSSRTTNPGEPMRVAFAANDPDGDRVEFVSWILDSTSRPPKRVAGPFDQASPDHTVIKAPHHAGEYLLMVYAIDRKGGGSASTLPFKVPEVKSTR